jgi:diguanylate cyclase (GGDEF)-like protein
LNKKRTVLFLIILFLIIFVTFFIFTKIYSEQIINLVLKEDLRVISSHHNNLSTSYKSTSSAIAKYAVRLNNVTNILSQANNASKKRKQELRNEFNKILIDYYNIIHNKGVLQFQFVLSNGESFYRFHNPMQFGDNVFKIREDFWHSIDSKMVVRGFIKGKFSHGFRNVFPIFNKKNECIGAMEVSFSSEDFQKHLNQVSGIHSHFLIHKSMIDANNSRYHNYKVSQEHPDYQSSLYYEHNNEVLFDDDYKKIKDIINTKIKGNQAFIIHYPIDEYTKIITFHPIKDMHNTAVAWVVSHQSNFIIGTLVKNVIMVRVLVGIILILILYFFIKQMKIKNKLEKQQKLLNDIFSITKNIIFITDFKKISFSNKQFDDLLSQLYKKDILSAFLETDGFLHQGLLKKGEDFKSLLKRTPKKNCIVSILDKKKKTKSYSISMAKLDNEYLVTLSNITEFKDHLEETEEKAYIDHLTKAFNRNKFNEVFEAMIKQSRLIDSALSLTIIDIDRFKTFNDTYGHLIGDEVLVTMSQTVKKSIRGTDIFARWGGEEFVILFQSTNMEHACIISDKIRQKIQANKHKIAGQITASFGVTEYEKGDTMNSMLKRCDDALYKAKDNGRNRVEKSI